jgi:hypothetical protein
MFGGDREQFWRISSPRLRTTTSSCPSPPPARCPRRRICNGGATLEVPGRGTLPATRLKAGETVAARAHVTGAHQFLNVNVVVNAELYFEEGELSSSAMSNKMFDPTTEEKKAGFK